MISTGNDIISLKFTNPERTKHERFYSKILSSSEHGLYYETAYEVIPFENFVWLLWSVKESVYKYLKRNIPDLVFSPRKIIIQTIDFPKVRAVTKFETVQYESVFSCEEEFYNCKVHFETETFYSCSKIYNELIYSVANDNPKFENIWWGIKFIRDADYASQSKEVRSFALNKLNSVFPYDHLQIIKRAAGYPVLLKEAKQMDIPVSFAHHDHYVAYSFVLKNFC